MKSSNIGGQAVIEGVMMKNKDRYAVAVRKPDGEIEVTTDTYKSVVGKYTALTKLPFVRGIFNFVDSLVLGMKTLTWSASFYEEEEEKEMTEAEEKKQERTEKLLMTLTMVVSFALAIGIFMVLPYFCQICEEMDFFLIQFGLSLRESSALRFLLPMWAEFR